MATTNTQNKNVEKVMRSLWDSLQSHFEGSRSRNEENRKFHTKCIKDYARDLLNESKIL